MDADDAPWEVVASIVDVIGDEHWVLVGGLMVRLHALRAGVALPRVTRDVDVVVDLQATGGSLGQLHSSLLRLGYALRVPDSRKSPAYRYENDNSIVDVMIPDHLPSWMPLPRLGGRPAFIVGAGSQAVQRRDTYDVQGWYQFRVGVPDELGALVAKGEAARVDPRNPDRHITDAAVLLASIDRMDELGLDQLSKNDRRRLRTLVSALEPNAAAWQLLEADERARGIAALGFLEPLVC